MYVYIITSSVGSASTSTKPSLRLPPAGVGKRRAKRATPGQDMGSYSALRPLDEVLPGELDNEGWDSEEDKDYRGYGWDYDSGDRPSKPGCRQVEGRGPMPGGKGRRCVTEEPPLRRRDW